MHYELEELSRAHTSPPTLTFDLDLLKFNHLVVTCGQGMTDQIW